VTIAPPGPQPLSWGTEMASGDEMVVGELRLSMAAALRG
jgi:hypothetical protein